MTTFQNVIKGHPVNFILYANNYEDIDEDHPLIEFFATPEQSLSVFREGTVMSKGTTTTTGIVHTYFANCFGPVQYKDLHEGLAHRFFQAFFKHNIPVGQIRTRLGLSGWERQRPLEASRELLKVIQNNSR